MIHIPNSFGCYMYFTRESPEALMQVSTRTGAGLLRSTLRECAQLALDAVAVFLLKRDFFSMCMTLLLVEGVS